MKTDYITNKMEVDSSIINAPVRVLRCGVIKDAFLDQFNPVDEFGDYTYLGLNSSTSASESEKKIIMTFEVPVVSNDIYDNIQYVNLALYCSKKVTKTAHLQLKYHYDNNWVEDGTTWMGQPYEYPDVIKTYTLNPGDTKVAIDIADIYFANANKAPLKLAFSLLEDENDGDMPTLQFYAKEMKAINNKFYDRIPAIEIGYEYYPPNIDLVDLNSKFKIRAHINDGYDPYESKSKPDLSGIVEIVDKYKRVDLDGKIGVTTYTGEDDLEACVTVKRKGWILGTEGQVTVKRTLPNDYDITPELESKVGIFGYIADDGTNPDPDDPAITHIPSSNLDINMETKTYYPDSYPEIEVEFIVRKLVPSSVEPAPDVEMEVTIPGYIADDGTNPDPDTNITHVPSSNLDATFTIRRSIPNDDEQSPDLEIEFLRPEYKADLVTGAIRYFDAETYYIIHVPSTELDCELTVRRTVPNDDEAAPDLDSQVTINQYIADDSTDPDPVIYNHHVPSSGLDAQLTILDREHIDGKISVNTIIADDGTNPYPDPSITHKPSSNLNCQIIVKRYIPNDDEFAPHMDGTVETKTYNDTNDVECVVSVKTYKATLKKGSTPYNSTKNKWITYEPAAVLDCIFYAIVKKDLECQVKIMPGKSMPGQIIVRRRGTSDLEIEFEIIKTPHLEYCYIL